MNIQYKCELHMLDCVDSTNNYVRSLDSFSVPQIVIAREQTKGKGTNGRSFCSNKDKGIYMSIAFSPRDGILLQGNSLDFTSNVGKTVASVLSKYSNDTPYTKPINDVYISGKKVAGILTEADTIGTNKFSKVIIGIGINLFKQEFPDEIKDIAGYIENPTYNFTKEDVLEDLINRIFSEYIVK